MPVRFPKVFKKRLTIIRPSETSRRPLQILLVEGSEHDFLALQRVLQKSAVSSVLTRYVRAEEALERLAADAASFDVVVTDYKLPGMSGLELCRELLQRHVSLPMVLMSGVRSDRLEIRALKAGFDDILIKDSSRGCLELVPFFLLNVVERHRCRRIIRQELEKSKHEAPHAAIAENMHEMVCRFLPDRTLTYANDAFCNRFSLNRQKVAGRNFMTFVHDEDKEKFNHHLEALRPEHPVGKVQCRVVLPSNEIRWQRWINRAIFDDSELLMEFQSVGWDITAEKNVEDRLNESEANYRFLLESLFDGFFVCEIESGNFLLINKKACDLFGYPMPEAFQHSLWDVMSPGEHDEFCDKIEANLRQKAPAPYQDVYTFLRKDGSEFRAQVSASLAALKGEQVVQVVFRDVAGQADLRLQLERTGALEGLAILATAIGHHFNNALAEITGNIGRLESDFPNHEDLSKYVEPIYDAAGQMSRLNSQLLAASRREPQGTQDTALNDTVKEILSLVRHVVDPAVRFETVLAPDLYAVTTDACQVQLKLLTLLTHLAEAIDGSGCIRITTRNEALDAEASRIHPGLKPERYACLTVEANEKGMDQSTRDKLVQSLSENGYEGDDISRKHAGWLAVVLDIEGGFKVSIYFPAAEKKETPPPETSDETVADEGFILVVEDDDTGAGITRAMLEKLGFRVLAAKTGSEAVRLARRFEGDIRVAFLDTVLPDMGGLEVQSLLKEIYPNIKVIILSDDTNNGLVQAILEAGADTVVEKPFTLEVLAAELAAISEGS